MTHFTCEVFAAADLEVVWGINEGDTLRSLEACCLGDIYQLLTTARPRRVDLDLAPDVTIRRVMSDAALPEGSALLSGTPVTPAGEATLMSLDGDLVTAVLLQIGDALFLMPLHPMRVGKGYTMITVKASDAGLRLSELAQGCFGAGARITTADAGLCPVEGLRVGQMLRTRDHGAQPLRWIGAITLRAQGAFAPVTFAPGALGNFGALTLGPFQRIFLYQSPEDRLGARAEILVQAQALVDGVSVLQRDFGFVTYYSLAFDDHQIVYAEGIPVESLLVSAATTARLPETFARDLAARFPQLNQRAHFAEPLPDAAITSDLRARMLGAKEK